MSLTCPTQRGHVFLISTGATESVGCPLSLRDRRRPAQPRVDHTVAEPVVFDTQVHSCGSRETVSVAILEADS